MQERKKNRMRGYDYSSEGAYFITICTFKKYEYFGSIKYGEMKLNKLGIIADTFWQNIPDHFDDIEIDEFVIMPDHIHGIIFISAAAVVAAVVGNRHACSLRRRQQPQHQKIPVIIGSYKSAVTRAINMQNNKTEFRWQKSYHDHIIRNEQSLNKIRKYIINNPLKWDIDIE